MEGKVAKTVSSFRLDAEQTAWLEDTAKRMGTTKAALLEDALSLAAKTNNAASENLASMWLTLGELFGEDAELTTWVDREEDGLAVARVRVDGEERLDVRGHVTIDEARGWAHVFLEIDGWSMVRHGSAYLGPQMFATMPLAAVAHFPWPPAEGIRTAAVARIGDVIHGGAQSPESA